VEKQNLARAARKQLSDVGSTARVKCSPGTQWMLQAVLTAQDREELIEQAHRDATDFRKGQREKQRRRKRKNEQHS
jgi:23S rRNA A2030 N6-methylase RlmJ